ncbi:MAG: hypothetical protein J5710_07240 [Treponema sp.]|nr:hypothetical protein [Treponema sp.]
MKSFEPVYKELEELFIHKLPEYIDIINKEHNDGIILKQLENHALEEYCVKRPCFKFGIDEAEYSEKDRIIENTIFSIKLELKLLQEKNQETILFWRYVEAIQKLFEESECDFLYKITGIKIPQIIIKITLCR